MESSREQFALQLLEAHDRWIGRLAKALVNDTDDAADLAQQTRIAVWRSLPADARAPKAWMSSVLSNLVRNRFRDRRRREDAINRHVNAVGVAVELQTPSDVLQRLEIVRRVTELIAALEEPIRQTIVLRYLDGLSSAEIARRTNVPAGTIRWRLKQGLDRLRQQLDEHPGGRKAWLAVFGVPSPSRSTWGWKRMLVAAIATASLAIVWNNLKYESSTHTVSEEIPEQNKVDVPRMGAVLNEYSPRFIVPPEYREDPKTAQIPGWAIGFGLKPRAIEGTVRSKGRPIANAEVRLLSGMMPFPNRYESRTTTDMAGQFRFSPKPATNFILSVFRDGLRPELAYVDLRVHPKPEEKPETKQVDINLQQCSRRLRGSVKDETGIPITTARVIASPITSRCFDCAGESVLVNAEGTFDVCAYGWNGNDAPVSLAASADGYATLEQALDSIEDSLVNFVLKPESVVAGTVTCNAKALENALVTFRPEVWRMSTTHAPEKLALTDAQGRFELRGLNAKTYRIMVDHDDCVRNAWYAPIEIVREKRIANLHLEASPVHFVDGIVMRNGELLPWTSVSIGQKGKVGGTSTNTDGTGRFRIGLVEMIADDILVWVPGSGNVSPISPQAFRVSKAPIRNLVLQMAAKY